MSEENEEKHLCITEDEFDKFQSVSMYQEEEYITLSDIVSPQPQIPDYGDMSQVPSDSEVVLTNNTPQENLNNEKIEESNLLKPTHYEDHTLLSNSSDKSQATTDILHPKKRGRKKKIIPTTPVDINISTDSQYLEESDTNKSLVVATKRGRMIKRPVHYNVDMLEKPKRGRTKKKSSSDTLLLSAADSTTVDNSSDNLMNNSDIPKLEEKLSSPTGTTSAKKRGRSKRMVSQSNNLSQSLESTARESSIDKSVDDFKPLAKDSTSSIHKNKKLKKGNLELLKEADLFNSKEVKTSLENTINDDKDDMLLSQLKSAPELSKEHIADQSHAIVDNNVLNGEPVSKEQNNIATSNNKTQISSKLKLGRQGKRRKICKETSSIQSTTEASTPNTKISEEDDDTDNLCLSKLKKSLNVDTPSDKVEEKKDIPEQVDSSFLMQSQDTENIISSKRNSKMPIMSDFEYNIDSIMASNSKGEIDAEEDQPNRRRKAKQQPHNYHEESDEDPFANVELSDDEPQKRRKGHRYNSDDEYIPGSHSKTKKRKESVESLDSYDSDLISDELDELNGSRKKRRKGKSDNNSPRKKEQKISKGNDSAEIDDIEEVLQSSVITASTSSWSAINEFENFIAKKIQGTNIQIKKVSESTEQKAPLEIPVLIPEKKKLIEMCSQTDKIKTFSVGIQTSTGYDKPVKEKIALTNEQSENACQFLNSIVRTTAELGQLMTQKSEDFIQKKIHTQNITDTLKMDYCVKKSYLLFKLAKHNLMQMEEDLSKQYEEFLQKNNLSSCREEEKALIANPKTDNDSDCEIVEEPVNPNKLNASQFNPKTVFLNKELSIKIAKKPTDKTPQPAQTSQQKLNIKGRHSVWINDTVMVKKVKPTQSFLAQDSRNKKPPDSFVTEKMVRDFFTEYKRQHAYTICAPFVSSDWITNKTECICNYFVTQNTGFSPSAADADTTSNFVPETNVENDKSVVTMKTSPDSLFTLCFQLLNKIFTKSSYIHKPELNKVLFNEKNNSRQPPSLLQLSLENLILKRCESPTLPKLNTDTECVSYDAPLTVLPLRTICYKRILELYTNNSVCEQLESSSDRCSGSEYYSEDRKDTFDIESIEENPDSDCLESDKEFDDSSYGIEMAEETEITPVSSNNEVRTLLSLCVKSIQKIQKRNYARHPERYPCSDEMECFEHVADDSLILTNNEVLPLFSLCVKLIQSPCKDIIKSCYTPKTIQSYNPKTLNYMAFQKVQQLLNCLPDINLPSPIGNMSPPLSEQQTGIDIPIVGVTINSVNTLSEEAYLNLVNVQTNVTNDTEYEDNFDDDNCDPYEEDHFESEFDAPQDRKQNWLTQVQIKEINPGVSSPITPEPEQESDIVIASIKLEPIETHFDTMPEVNAAMPTVDNTILIKSEAGPGLNEMTMIPDISHIKSEADDTNGIGIQRLNSNSYDCDTFENFVRSNKMMAAANYSEEDIFSQSALRVRRQHEPDLDDGNDMGMSLLIPQTFETINIDTAKGSLMESSSDEASKSKKNPGKKKIERKTRTKSKKTDPKVLPNKDTPSANKDKKVVTEVAVLTRRMRERIRQEEKKGDSTDSENETLYSLAKTDKSKSKTSNSEDEDETLYALPKGDKSKPNAGDDSENETLYSLPKKDKSKSKTSGKVTETAIQCNNVDSTANVVDEHDDVSEKFTGFTTIDQTETTSYQKFMKYVFDKIIPDETEDKTKLGEHSNNVSQNKESDSPLFKENEPVELLECEPTMPFFDDDSKSVTNVPKPKSKKNAAKSGTIKSDNNLSQEPMPSTTDINAQFIERHGWKCYPVNGNDTKLSQTPCLLLEKLPETFVETYFQYCNITASKSKEDEEVDRLTNLSTLNRSTQLKEPTVREKKVKKDGKAEVPSERRSGSETRTASACSDRGAELTPSEDEGGNIDDESAPLGPKQTDNILAKDSLMNDSDSDGGGKVTVKTEPPDDTAAPVKKYKPGPKSKTRGVGNKVEIPEPGSLMLTADKMMNKELTLLHAPIVMKEGESSNPPSKKLIPRACKRSSPRIRAEKEKGPDDDSSSEEEKQWVNTKEKLLKRMGRKEDAIVDDAKRTKLVTDFIERRADMPDSHKRSRGSRVVRSRKKFLERQKQLKILSRELFGEPATDGTHKRSAQANFKGRRNIRKVIDKKSLARSTVVANMEEFERKKRLNNRQTRLRELLGCEEGVNVLVINDEVCLEYDFEEHRPVVTVHPFFTKVMKAHQYEGVKFMWDACFESLSVLESGHPGGGCILAHCMGLGKTLQVLALLHTVLTHPRVGMRRILVCCPLSTVLNWVDEIHKWIGPVTNEIKVFELSKLKKTYERAYQLEDWYNGGGIFIIGYELFRSLSTLDPFIDNIRPTIVNKIRTALLDPGPDIIVCDEGHLLKNDCSVLAVAMSRVVTKRRIVLTGTPMQNNLREYYCMVDFVKPNLLGTYSEYSNRFENPIMNGQHRDSSAEDIKLMKARTHILHKVLEGCLQRQEAAVLYPYLPKKHEYTLFIPLTKCQWDLYKHYINNCAKQSKQSILKDFHILHKIWSHPQVLHNFQTKARDERAKIKAEKLEDDLATEDQEEIKPNETDIWWLEHLDGGRMLEKLEASNKFVAVFRILDECVALGDKLLIFSTSLFCLDSLEYFLKRINNWSLGQEYFRLDGSVPPEVRQKWCREFNADNNVKTKLFLVSTRAGCLGLNMTAANRVIIMDTSWNPAHDIQSIFRVYRFGQKKDCFIYRLVAMGSMEQKIYERSVTKQAVACRVVDEQQIDRHYNSAELTELYMYDESGSSVAGGVAVGVQDVVLLRVARVAALHAVHEHDSLLRGSEPALPEHERVAAWQQFQQEQEDKQIQNSLGVYPPKIKIPLKRIYGPEIAKPENIKQEETDTPNVATPTEAKPSKRRKKNLIVNCRIPVQVEDGNSEGFKPVLQHVVKTDIVDIPPVAIPEVPIVPVNNEVAPRRRGRPRKADPRAGPSQAAPAPVPLVDNEEMMVEKITEVLLKHNIQNRKLEIGMLIASVKKVVAKGVPSDDKALRGDNELARSIAKILLEQSASQMKPSAVTDIVCESITNTVTLDHQVEEITGDIPSVPIEKPTNKYKPKPKRFKDKSVVDDRPKKVTESPLVNEPENRTKRKAALDAKKSIGNMSQDIVINLDEDDDSADVDFVPADDDEDCNSVQIKIEPEAAEVVKPTKKTPTKPESVVKTKTPSKAETVIKTKTPIIVKAGNIFTTKNNKENNKKVEVRKPAPQISKKASDKVMTSIELSDEDEPLRPAAAKAVAEESTEEVPLPLSLLTNKNFIKIVAHTYLAGNPMLDEDAATLAAQYSTYRALKEAELSGKPILNGPIYDIALKILGPNILKKLQVVNDKKLTESNATVQQLQDNIQAIQAHLEPEPSTSSNKPKPKRQGTSLAPLKPVAAPSKVVPVGLISRAAPSAPAFTPQAPAEAEECILPDDDECIISDNTTVPLQSTPEIQPTPTTSAARFPGDSSRQLFGTPTVSAATAATPVTAKHPRNVLKIFNGRVVMPSDPNQVEVQPDTDNTICLDSDDEDAAPVVPVSLTAAFSGVRLPLPNVPPNPAALGKPPIIFRAKMPTQVGPRVSTPRAITTENKILAKPGDLYVISDTGQVEVLSKEQVKAPGLEAGPRNLKPVSKPTKFVPIASKPVPIAPKPTSVAPKPAPIVPKPAPVAPKPAPIATKPVPIAPKPAPIAPKPAPIAPKPNATVSKPVTQADTPIKPVVTNSKPDPPESSPETRRSTTIESDSSSDESSRSSSPENPLSILKDVVHIQAADDRPRRSRQKTEENTKSVQDVVTDVTKNKSSLSRSTTNSNRAVIDVSYAPSTSKNAQAESNKTINTPSKPNVHTYTVKAKQLDKVPTKIVGTTKNIILDGTKGLKLTPTAVYTHNAKTIKLITTSTKPATDMKRGLPPTNSSVAKKTRKQPMTLKDFDIDDIDDIIELE